MSDKPIIIKAGTPFVVTSGEYSDYGMHGMFVALADFDPVAERDAYKAAHPEQGYFSSYDSGYLAYLCGRGLLMEVAVVGLHLGDYSLDEMEVVPINGNDASVS